MNYRFPCFSFEILLHALYRRLYYRRYFKKFGKNSYLSPFSEIINMKHIEIGDYVTIRQNAWMLAHETYTEKTYTPHISIGDNTYIGHNVTLSCAIKLEIGKDVTIGDNAYIADCTHSYEDIKTHIMLQQLKTGKIIIGDRAWIGKNCVIMYDLEIGEHAVVGANSVITKSVPPYTVMAGNPATIIKQYDFIKEEWISV